MAISLEYIERKSTDGKTGQPESPVKGLFSGPCKQECQSTQWTRGA